jgi:hypothetical protein
MNCTRIGLYESSPPAATTKSTTATTEHSPGLVTYGVARIDQFAFVSSSTWRTPEQVGTATTQAPRSSPSTLGH